MLPQANRGRISKMASMSPVDSSPSPLSRLFWLRNLTLAGLLALMLWSQFGIGVKLPWLAMGVTLTLLAGLNAFTALRRKQPQAPHPVEIFMQLLADLAGLTVLLLYTGGWANPFVSLLLLPVVIGALLLPPGLAWLAGGLAVAAYTLLAYFNLPLDIPPEKAFYLHVSGMWFTFAASVGVVVFFVVRLRDQLRDQEAALAAAREETLRNEQVVAVALVAAGTAHELATPLSTLALLNESLLAGESRPPQKENLQLMATQIDRCRNLLRELSRTAQAGSATRQIDAGHYLAKLVDDWRLLRPSVDVRATWQGEDVGISPPASLDQALLNLLNNAADAAPGQVCLEGRRAQMEKQDGLRIDILDSGAGPAPAREALLKPGQSSKNGLGIGLFLSNASIERLGGQVSWHERKSGGARVSVWIPLEALSAYFSRN